MGQPVSLDASKGRAEGKSVLVDILASFSAHDKFSVGCPSSYLTKL